MDEDLDFELDRFQRSKWEQLKSATRLAFEHRKRVREGDFSVFLMPLAFAIVKDAIFDFIPIVGILFGFFITAYLFIFLWGRGKWKVRLVIFFLSFFDSIPFVNFLPFQTLCVAYAYHVAKKDADRSKAALESLSKATPKIADDLRGVTRQRALAASRAEERSKIALPTQAPRITAPQLRETMSSRQSGNNAAAQPARPTSPEARTSSGSQGISRPVLGQKAANDASYAMGRSTADAAIMRIHEAGKRLSQTSSPLAQSNVKTFRPKVPATPARTDIKRAA